MNKIRTVVVFKKRPSAKNFEKRSISFSEESEFKHVQKTDNVEIEVHFEGGLTRVEMSGETFRNSIKQVEMKTGKKIFVLRY